MLPQQQDLNRPARLDAQWASLPTPLRQSLTLASTGWRHLARTGALCLELARAEEEGAERHRLLALAAELLLWAWGENPLHGPLAAQILSAPDLPLAAASRAALRAVAAQWRIPAEAEGGLAYFERLAARRDTDRLADFLAGQVRKAPDALFWREKALALALFAGEAQAEACAGLNAAAVLGLEAGGG
ncbi:MAG: hypothetical protein KKA55_07855, partial [Proteobacteria bacterium]|nr:hypothetical protein [Pseudomonadota bacterium]